MLIATVFDEYLYHEISFDSIIKTEVSKQYIDGARKNISCIET